MFKGLIFFVKHGWKYDRRYILWNIFYQLVTAPVPLVMAIFPKLIIDELLSQKQTERLIIYTVLFAAILLVTGCLSVYFQKDGFSRRCRVAAEFDNDLHRTLYLCDYENLENPAFLDLQEKSKKFLYCNWHGFGYLLDCSLNVLSHCITLIGIALILVSLNIWLVLLIVFLSLCGAVIDSGVQKKVKQLEDSVIDDQRRWMYFVSLFEKTEHGKEFRVYRIGEWLLAKERKFFTRACDTLKKQNTEFIRSGIITTVFTFLEQLAIYGHLIYSVLYDRISIGEFTMYASAVTSFAAAFRGIFNTIVEIKSYDLYYDDLEEYLSVPSDMRSGIAPVPDRKEHRIEFVNVSFKYPGSEHFTLKNISVSLHAGEKLMIVGENGAGKTTFIKLLLRLYDPTEGEILLDGENIKTMNYDNYISLFATVFQDYHLFAFSLKENIAMTSSADDAKTDEVLTAVGLKEKVSQLIYGSDTEVHKIFDDTGFEPSGGEGQRLAIARALYKDAPIIILDEPTAALDPKAESEIYEQFQNMVLGKTAIYVSHRLNSAKFSDRIIVFENGSVTECGSHKELLAQNRKYAELFRMQADFYQS